MEGGGGGGGKEEKNELCFERFRPSFRPSSERERKREKEREEDEGKKKLFSLTNPGIVMMSEMPCTPWRSTSSASRKASERGVASPTTPKRLEKFEVFFFDFGFVFLGSVFDAEFRGLSLVHFRRNQAPRARLAAISLFV